MRRWRSAASASPKAVAPLTGLLTDADAEVRQAAAFALGLIGDASAAPALAQALSDPTPMVRGRAAEALGLIGAKDAAPRRSGRSPRSMRGMRRSPAVSPTMRRGRRRRKPKPSSSRSSRSCGSRAWEPLAAAVLDGDRPVTPWWPVAYALQRINDPRALPALAAARGRSGQVHRGVCRPRPGRPEGFSLRVRRSFRSSTARVRSR